MQKLVHKNIRKLIKLSTRSVVVSLPIEYVNKLNWRAGQKVVVTKKGRHLIIKDWLSPSKSRHRRDEVGEK